MTVTPDLAGFLASRQVLYDNFGLDVAFLIPIAPGYLPSVPMNPFGEPLDPWAQPASGAIEGVGYSSAFVTCTLVTRPYGGRGQVRDQEAETPVGIVADQMLGLNRRVADFARVGPGGSVGEATRCAFWGQTFEIRQWRPDGVGGLERYVVYITQASAV